ncbi:MAG: helix-turn-helix domain-containing protein [Rhodocyclaceae bacterium]|nr:helix-turn-helix domain-containing protein [Rhodocyclaceae bacterium]
MNSIEQAAKHVGSFIGLAKRLGVSASMVSQWKAQERPVSPIYACAIERETGGTVTVQNLRPDLNWARLPDADWPHPEGRPLLDAARSAVAAS